jgi:hemoglobin
MKQLFTCAALALCALANSAALAQSNASAYPVPPAPGLYLALGEQAGLRALMDDFVQRLAADPRLAAQFKEAKLDHLASQLSAQVCQLAGGPCTYQGPDMKTAHANMDVTRTHFNALVEVLQVTMDAHHIPFARQNQLLALLAPMHRDVINTH